MPQLIEVYDQNSLVPTSKFSYLKFPFEKFNPVQSRVFEYYNSPVNIVVAAATSVGKTTVAEMCLSHEIYHLGGKGMYVGPLKALSQEKIDDWSHESHSFSNLNLSICTGDYRLTKDRYNEIKEANLVIATSEMLNSRIRNYRSDQNSFLKDVGTLVTDESHLLAVPGRGDKCEVAIMKMAKINPKCRHVFLSATMPNVDEIARWLMKLTDRDTVILQSTYRPCPLELHYVTYNDSHWKYDAKEAEKISTAMNIIRKHPNDKFLIFVHSKKTGGLLKKALLSYGIDTEFHNADLDLKKRTKLESKFKNDPKFRVIIATSTLAIGVNMPARRVIILGVHKGLTEVPTYEIFQMAGRAGRPQYDPQGDVYILLGKKDQGTQRLRLENPQRIQSQLVQHGSDDYRTLAFHVISEICQGDIDSVDGIYDWYNNTLASFQRRNLEEHVVDNMIDHLLKKGILREENGKLYVTPVGKIASLFYYSPFDVVDLRNNFGILFENNKEKDELWISVALAKTDSNVKGFVSNLEAEQMEGFLNRLNYDVRYAFGNLKGFTPNILKTIFCYYQALNGFANPFFNSTLRAIQSDVHRTLEVISAIDSMSAKWNKAEYFKTLSKKMTYGVDWQLLNLCAIDGVGKVKATKLWKANIKTPTDIVNRPKLVKSLLNCSDKVLEKLMESAQNCSK